MTKQPPCSSAAEPAGRRCRRRRRARTPRLPGAGRTEDRPARHGASSSLRSRATPARKEAARTRCERCYQSDVCRPAGPRARPSHSTCQSSPALVITLSGHVRDRGALLEVRASERHLVGGGGHRASPDPGQVDLCGCSGCARTQAGVRGSSACAPGCRGHSAVAGRSRQAGRRRWAYGGTSCCRSLSPSTVCLVRSSTATGKPPMTPSADMPAGEPVPGAHPVDGGVEGSGACELGLLATHDEFRVPGLMPRVRWSCRRRSARRVPHQPGPRLMCT